MKQTNPFSETKIVSYYEDALKIKQGVMPTPRMAMIYPTYVCNFKCPHCLYSNMKGSKVSYPYPKFIRAINELSEIGVKGIVFCGGGEPTLYPKFKEIVAHINNCGIDFGILTNGSTLDKYGKLLIDVGKFIRISIDSIDDSNYRKIHHPPRSHTLKKQLSIVENLIEYRNKTNSKCSIGIKTLLSRNNLHEKDKIKGHFTNMGVDYVQFKAARGCKDEIKGYSKTSLSCKCFMSPIQTMLDAYGDVYICCFYQYRFESHKFGNIYNNSFSDVWYSKEHDRAIQGLKTKECNKYDCKFHEYNRVMNDMLNNDPYHLNFF